MKRILYSKSSGDLQSVIIINDDYLEEYLVEENRVSQLIISILKNITNFVKLNWNL